MKVMYAGTETGRMVSIRPRAAGATAVSVADVITTVEAEATKAEQQGLAGGGHSYNSRSSIRRGSDGAWRWRGLDQAGYEALVLVLYL